MGEPTPVAPAAAPTSAEERSALKGSSWGEGLEWVGVQIGEGAAFLIESCILFHETLSRTKA